MKSNIFNKYNLKIESQPQIDFYLLKPNTTNLDSISGKDFLGCVIFTDYKITYKKGCEYKNIIGVIFNSDKYKIKVAEKILKKLNKHYRIEVKG